MEARAPAPPLYPWVPVRRIVPLLVTLAGAGLIALLVFGLSTQTASRSLDQQLHEGHDPRAPEASRRLLILGHDERRSLASLRGKVVLLNFWASWCEPCQAEAPLLERGQGRLAAHDATVLGVTYLDNTDDSEGFVKRFHITYPNLRDNENGDFAHAYGTDQLPESFIVNRQGRIVAISRGEIEESFLDKAVSLAEST